MVSASMTLSDPYVRFQGHGVNCDMYQFGFKKGLSTGLCTSVVQRTVDSNRGRYVFTCFIDFQKAFDRVN